MGTIKYLFNNTISLFSISIHERIARMHKAFSTETESTNLPWVAIIFVIIIVLGILIYQRTTKK